MIRILIFSLLLTFAAIAQEQALPYSKLTPGDTFPVTVEQLSQIGYSKHARHVSTELCREVFAEIRNPVGKAQCL
jgi:hypothetical protein